MFNNSVEENQIFMTVKEISSITGKAASTLKDRCLKNKYTCRTIANPKGGGKQYEILVSTLERELQEKILDTMTNNSLAGGQLTDSNSYAARFSLQVYSSSIGSTILSVGEQSTNAPVSLGLQATESVEPRLPVAITRGENPPVNNTTKLAPFSSVGQLDLINYTAQSNPVVVPEKAKKLALAKVDLIRHWQNYRSGFKNKKQGDAEFVFSYNANALNKDLFKIVGKVSLASLYRWQKDLKANYGDYRCLICEYKYGAESVITTTAMTPLEQTMLLNKLFNPAKMQVGTIRRTIAYELSLLGITEVASYATYNRVANKLKRNFYDMYILFREREKALKDKVAPYIERDVSKCEVGDILVADGNTLDFTVKHPLTGNPCRATLIVYEDWKSKDIAGYEIMVTENTQCIASALRNSILRLGKVPKICYQDNGAAFRSKFFRGDKNFQDAGFNGLFGALGIIPVYADPYNARAKICERFFREFTSTCSCQMPSYGGNCIENKPAHLKRNEKFHKKRHIDYIPTIQEALGAIENWLAFYRSQPCPNVPGKTIGEVFNEGKGEGVNESLLNDLMMAEEVRKIGRNGVTLFGNHYYNEALYGIKDNVIVRYSLFDISRVQIYSCKGEFICEATTVLKVNAMAEYMGEATDVYTYKQELKRTQNAIKKTMKTAAMVQGKLNTIPWQTDQEQSENKKAKSIKHKDYAIKNYRELPFLEDKTKKYNTI